MISAVDYAFLLTGVGVLIGGTYVRKLKQTWSLHSASLYIHIFKTIIITSGVFLRIFAYLLVLFPSV